MATTEELLAELDQVITEQDAASGTAIEALNATASEPRSLSELTRGYVTRDTMAGAGGTLGGIIGGGAGAIAGVPTGPGAGATAALGMAAGGALGSAVGSSGYDALEATFRSMGLLGGKNRSAGQIFQEATEQAATDAAFTGGFQVVGKMSRPLLATFGRVLGVNEPQFKMMVDEAANTGLLVSAGDIVEGGRKNFASAATKAIGVMPFVRGGMVRGAATKVARLNEAVDNMMFRLAPWATMQEIGIDVAKAAQFKSDQFRRTAGRLYGNFERLATNASIPEIVPTSSMRAMAADIAKKIDGGAITLRGGDTLEPIQTELEKYVAKLAALPDAVSMRQFASIADDIKKLDAALDTGQGDISLIRSFRLAAEDDLSRLRTELLPEGEGEAIQKAFKLAKTFFAKHMPKFETPTAQKFQRVDRNIFKPGPSRPGSLSDDEIAQYVVNLKSPQAIKDLRALVGDEPIAKATRNYIETQWNSSIRRAENGDIVGVDWDGLKTALGFGEKSGKANGEALREMLSSSRVDFNEVKSLINMASRIDIPKQLSAYLSRRVGIGGQRGLVNAMTAGATVGGRAAGLSGAIGTFGVTVLIRNIGTILADPAKITAMQRVLDPKVPVQFRRAILGRLVEVTMSNNAEQNRAEAAGAP